MNFTKATDQQLKTIIESDTNVPAPLLKKAYEEAMGRKLFHKKIEYFIIKFFKNKATAERKTGLSIEELMWICYEVGHEFIERYKPDKPYGAFWYGTMLRKIKDIARDNNTQKRTGTVYSLEGTHDWIIPGGNHTEPIALQRVYIDSLMNQLTDIEKEIVIMRYQGYYLHEIGKKQGISRGGIQRRIENYQKRLKGA